MYKLPSCTWVRKRPKKNLRKGVVREPNVSTAPTARDDEKIGGRKYKRRTKIMLCVFCR